MSKKHLIFILSLGLALGFNLYFSAFPITFPQLKKEAQDKVEQKIIQQSREEVDKKFPDFDALAKDKLAGILAQDYKRHKKDVVNKLTQEEYGRLKNRYQDEFGQTYLLELDGWHWARYVENVLRRGYPGDEIIKGRQTDKLMLVPSGNLILWDNFLFYFCAFLYKIFSFFIKGVPLFTFLFYVPLFFTLIFILALYLFCYYRWGNIAALIACLFVGLSPTFLSRSCAGWFKKETLALLWSLLVVWPYLSSYNTQTFRRRVLFIALAAFFVGLFCFSWTQWWFIFFILIIYEIYSLVNILCVYCQYKEKDAGLLKGHLITLFLFPPLSLFFVVILCGISPLKFLYLQIRQALVLNNPLTGLAWPNVYFTVAELKRVDFLQISLSLGGIFIFLASLGCLLILFLRTARNMRYTKFEREAIVIMTFWFLSMFFACLKGARFILFLTIPLGVSLGWGIKQSYMHFRERNKKWALASAAGVILLLSFNCGYHAFYAVRGIFPLMNDFWYRTLTKIKEATPPESVINSWWDFGDWFTTVARRKVIFDGQSQNLPQAYWMARVFMTEDEKEAVKILRMLNNAGNQAFELINGSLKDPFKSAVLLKSVLTLQPQAAKEALAKYLPSSQTEDVMRILSMAPGKAYFVVDYTLQDKIGALCFIGNWDFTRAYLAEGLHKRSRSEIIDYLKKWLGVDGQKAERLYQEASLIQAADLDRWVSVQKIFHGRLVKGEEKGEDILFGDGMIYKPKEQTVYLYSPREARYHIPKSLFIFKEDKLEEIPLSGGDLGFSVLIIKGQDGYESILLDPGLARSMLVRLYFLGGKGLKYFKPFMDAKEGDNHIRVFEILWE